MSKKPYEKAAEETAIAVQLVAKVASKGIDKAEALGTFLHAVIGAGLAQLGGAFEDWAGTYRYLNALKLADKVEQIHDQRKITGKAIPIPARLGIPLLQRAFLEDDDIIQNMWAGLIANATDPNFHAEPRRNFIEFLSALEPLDALVLREIEQYEIMYPTRQMGTERLSEEDEERMRSQWPNLDRLIIKLGTQVQETALSLENLSRLELAFDRTDTERSGIPVPITHSLATIELTHTGRALLRACAI